MTPPTTQAVTNLQGMVQQGSDPSIPYHYAQKRADVSNTYRNPLGAYTSSATRDAADRVTGQRMSMDEAEAIKASNYLSQQGNFDRQSVVAQLTQPQMVQTGSSGTQSHNPGIGSYISSGAGIAASLI